MRRSSQFVRSCAHADDHGQCAAMARDAGYHETASMNLWLWLQSHDSC